MEFSSGINGSDLLGGGGGGGGGGNIYPDLEKQCEGRPTLENIFFNPVGLAWDHAPSLDCLLRH